MTTSYYKNFEIWELDDAGQPRQLVGTVERALPPPLGSIVWFGDVGYRLDKHLENLKCGATNLNVSSGTYHYEPYAN
jgi:hypothetical protein